MNKRREEEQKRRPNTSGDGVKQGNWGGYN